MAAVEGWRVGEQVDEGHGGGGAGAVARIGAAVSHSLLREAADGIDDRPGPDGPACTGHRAPRWMTPDERRGHLACGARRAG